MFSLVKDELLTQYIRYALSELQKDVEEEILNHPESEREALRKATKFAIFVVHNKVTRPKMAGIPASVLSVQPLLKSIFY